MSAHTPSSAGILKRLLFKPLAVPGVAETLARLTHTQATIFMLHRFSSPAEGVSGHDPLEVRRNLGHLRKQHYDLISLEELFRRLQKGEPLKRAVAFTIDDGYFDHGRIGGPVFAEYDCPVTTFATTGFLDGKIWFWWDRIRHIFDETKRAHLRARLGNEEIVYHLDSIGARAPASLDLSLRCQDVTEAVRLACIDDLSLEADVEVPTTPPARFAPLSWDEARALEKGGMTFGPHTVTHPVLSTTPDDQAEFEIVESWSRLTTELSRPTPVFCYPSGRARDFGDRELAIVQRLGLLGGVSGQPGVIRPPEFRQSPSARYRVPRFGYQDSLPHMLQCVSGLAMMRSRMRGARA